MSEYVSIYTGENIDDILSKAEILPNANDGNEGQLLVKTNSGTNWQEVVALPAGGTSGQILTKNSTTDGDAIWSTNFNDNAASATRLTLSAGSNSQPIFFNNGQPQICNDLDSGIEIYTGTLLAANWAWYNDASGTTQAVSDYENKWFLQRYSSITMNSNALTNLSDKTPTASGYYSDVSTSISMNMADSYTGKATTYIYCDKDVNVSMRFETDDAGAAFLNGVCVATNSSCTWSSVASLSFKQGENILQVCYTEGSGGDGWVCDPKPSTLVGTSFVSMCAVPMGGYTQTITPTRLGKTSTLNNTTILFNPTSKSNAYNTIKGLRYINEHGTSIANSNGTITVKTCDNMKPPADMTVYWIGYTPK